MRRPKVFLGCIMLVAGAQACVAQTNQRASDKPVAKAAAPKPAQVEPSIPARYVLTEGIGVSYDESGEASPIPARDFAIVSGKRLVLSGGVVVESVPSPEPLSGFRSLPKHLGGGYVFWSDSHTFRAPTFLGKLERFVDIGSLGGVRPWLDSFVLRTSLGLLEVDPKTLAVRRTDLARFSEVLSLDGQVGVRVDATGRAEVSADGGKTFRDVTTEKGRRFSVPSVVAPDKLRLSTSDPEALQFLVDRTGTLVPFDPWASSAVRLSMMYASMPAEEPAYTRRFAPAELSSAVVAGALLPGERIMTSREMSMRVLSAKSGNFVHDLAMTDVSEVFSHCQPVMVGEEPLLACNHARGAHLFALKTTPSRPQLEATFPESRGFVAGIGRRFAFLGRCGSQPPTMDDFPGGPPPAEPSGYVDPLAPPAPPSPDSFEPPPPPPEDEAAVCVRRADGTWVEHRLVGDDARELHVFVPGDNGEATAFVLTNSAPDKPVEVKPEGLHIIRLNRNDERLRRKSFPSLSQPSEFPPYRSMQRDLWLDEKDGSVHGWVTIDSVADDEGDTEEPNEAEPSEASAPRTKGPMAGVRIGPDGSIEVYAVPTGVTDMVYGGRFGLARAETESGPKYYETTDGGRTFVEVAGPAVGDFAEPQNDNDLRGCSAIGCSLGGGLVRLGWGGAPPATNKSVETNDADALSSKVFDSSSLFPPKTSKIFTCRLEDKTTPDSAEKTAPFAITTQAHAGLDIGQVQDHKWTVLATTPFELRAPHRVDFSDVSADKLSDFDIVSVLGSSATAPVGIILRANDTLRFDLSPGPKRTPVTLPAEAVGNIGAQIDRERYVVLDARSGELRMVHRGVARTVMQFSQIPDVTLASVTLARRAGTGDDVLALAFVQGGSGEVLLGDIDLGKGTVGPLRIAGNVRGLDTAGACVRGPKDYRMVVDDVFLLSFDPPDERRTGVFGSSLITLGSGRACREASEIRLANDGTLVLRSSDGAGLIHERGKSLRARCVSE